MSDRYELFKKEPCHLDVTKYTLASIVPWRCPSNKAVRCDGCIGDGSRRVPTGRMVEDLAPFVWSGRDAAFLDCGDEGPAVGESPVFVEVTDDAE